VVGSERRLRPPSRARHGGRLFLHRKPPRSRVLVPETLSQRRSHRFEGCREHVAEAC
jgi:hypothetical protein